MKKLYFKKMHIYLLHRNNQLDHKKGRPAILLKYKTQTSLVWWGTHKKENSNETSLKLIFNDIPGYFYAKGIEKVPSESLKDVWANHSTYKGYILTDDEQKQLITKFISFTDQKNPYQKIVSLEIQNQFLQRRNKILEAKNNYLKEQLENEYQFE